MGSLKEDEKRALVAKLIDEIPDIVLLIDREQKLLCSNRAAQDILENKNITSAGEKCFEIFGKENECKECPFDEVAKGKVSKCIKKYIKSLDSWYECKLIPSFNENGTVDMVIDHLRNIDEEIQLREKLKKKEEMYRVALHGNIDAVYVLEAIRRATEKGIDDFVIIDINSAAEKEIGLIKDEIVGKRLKDSSLLINIEENFEKYKDVFLKKENLSEEYFVASTKIKPGWYYHQVVPTEDGIIIFNRNITKEKLKKITIENKEHELGFITDNIPVSLAYLYKDLTYLFVNKSYCEWYQKKKDEIHGKRLFDIIGMELYERSKERINDVLSGKIVKYHENRIRESDGEERDFYITLVPDIRGKIKEVIGFIVIHQDYTEVKKMEKSLIEERDVSLKASQIKTNFLANMSHELRTPLNGIIGFTDIMYEMEKDTEKKEMMSMIRASGRNLMELINDILDFSKLETGKLKLSNTDFNIEEIIRELREEFYESSVIKGLDFIIEIEEETKGRYVGDKLRIKQIISNLLSNAIKFTERGEVKLTINSLVKNELLEFVIADTGIGISVEKQRMIFEKFEQGEHYLNKKYNGTGIGLAITKSLLSLMHGFVYFESAVGKGSTFSLGIPMNRAKNEKKSQPGTEDVKSREHINKRLNILLVEDNKINQKIIVKNFENKNIELSVAENGEEAVKKFMDNNYDLILMDVFMPVMNGIEATLRIRNSTKADGKKVKIIGLSAFSLPEEIKKALECGMDDYISKPFKQDDLFEKVYKWGMREESE